MVMVVDFLSVGYKRPEVIFQKPFHFARRSLLTNLTDIQTSTICQLEY